VTGGGTIPGPGEVSLAHHGVLLLMNCPEFRRSVLEVLRQRLEDGQVTIARASMALTFPAGCGRGQRRSLHSGTRGRLEQGGV